MPETTFERDYIRFYFRDGTTIDTSMVRGSFATAPGDGAPFWRHLPIWSDSVLWWNQAECIAITRRPDPAAKESTDA